MLNYLRQSTTIYGISVILGTTVALATRQLNLSAAEAFYTAAITMILLPQKTPIKS